jgi:hemolysin activation/secretion protein
MEQLSSQQTIITLSVFGLTFLTLFPSSVLAQNPPQIDRSLPRQNPPLPPETPSSPPKPELQFPQDTNGNSCQISKPSNSYRDRFLVKDIQVIGNTVLNSEIDRLIRESNLKYRTATFEDLVCLRSRINALYLENGYVTSGAFLTNNQDLSQGIIQIQVIEGELEAIQISGLNRLAQSYVRNRLRLAATTPLNREKLETALQLLVLNPLVKTLSAELTAGKQPGSNVLLIDIQEADALKASVAVDNYRAPSIGEIQGSVSIAHNNLLGFGDRANAQYGLTEGLNIYNAGYTLPINSRDGTLSFSYDNSNSDIIEERFRKLDIESETETFSLNLRQPLVRTPNKEFSVTFGADLRRRRTFLQGEPFSFSPGVENGKSNVTVLRFSQDWVDRNATRVIAARSQFNIGIDAFNATINNTEPDGKFFAWQGQFQWVQQVSDRNLIVVRIGGQYSPDALLSLEQFSLGGESTIRGYQENQLITDSGILASLEFRIPLTANPNTLQLTPFIDVGTGWNNQEPDPDPKTVASVGLELDWSIAPRLNLSVDYGIPLIAVDEEGDSLQENGLHFSLRYQAF